jgi:hypothetical protein
MPTEQTDGGGGPIEHVIVLMLENRSYDHLLGGVALPATNACCGGTPEAALDGDAEVAKFVVPCDGSHSHKAVLRQMRLGTDRPMTGFADSYVEHARGRSPDLTGPLSRRAMGLGVITIAAGVAQWWLALVAVVWLAAVVVLAMLVWRLAGGGVPLGSFVEHNIIGLVRTPVLVLAALVAVVVAVAAVLRVWSDRLALRVPLLVVLVLAGGGLVWFGWRLRAKPNLVAGATDAAFFARVAGAVHDAARIHPLAVLASSFATCTRWHCSVPGETWPNRNFAHAGTSDGSVDIEYRLFGSRTIFDVLAGSLPSDGRRPWRVYFGDIPQVLAFEGLWRDCAAPVLAERFRPLDDLIDHIEADTLPAYAFVEPHHHNSVLLRDGYPGSSSQHPNNNRVEPAAYGKANEAVDGRDFGAGLGLVARIYEALRTHPAVFDKTVFVVTYDEHGGMHDHVPPPNDALAPERGTVVHRLARSTYRVLIGLPVRFDFATLGPRVPAIVVSPWIPAGTVCGQRYDHASIPRTVRSVFGCQDRLSRREDGAATLDHLWRGLDAPRRDDLPPLDEWVRNNDMGAVTPSGDGRLPPLDSNHRELSRLARRVVAQVDANTRKQVRTAAAGPLTARARVVLPRRQRAVLRNASEVFVQSADALQALTRQTS